jgi:large subunit ribosomal protein L30
MAEQKSRIRVKLVRSLIGRLPVQRRTIHALGLNKIGSENEIVASDSVKGMVRSVSHLVSVEEIE